MLSVQRRFFLKVEPHNDQLLGDCGISMIGRFCYLLSWNIRPILTVAVPKRILTLRPWSEAK